MTGRSVDIKTDGDMRTSVPALTWQAPRRFHLTEYRVFVLDDTALADKLGPLGKASKRDGGGNTIQFSAEADGELLPTAASAWASPCRAGSRSWSRASNSIVVPGRATREPETHSHRETFGEDSWLLIFAKPNPVVMDPGLTLRVPRDDSGVPGKRPRGVSAL
ncbi:hypothetical protein ACQ5SK_22415 [Bradyrhizobium japonicum]